MQGAQAEAPPLPSPGAMQSIAHPRIAKKRCQRRHPPHLCRRCPRATPVERGRGGLVRAAGPCLRAPLRREPPAGRGAALHCTALPGSGALSGRRGAAGRQAAIPAGAGGGGGGGGGTTRRRRRRSAQPASPARTGREDARPPACLPPPRRPPRSARRAQRRRLPPRVLLQPLPPHSHETKTRVCRERAPRSPRLPSARQSKRVAGLIAACWV